MSTQGSTANYVELTGQAYGLIVDAFASVSRSRLDYWKSVWEIASRPYTSTAIDATVRENFDRAQQLADLTVGEFRSRGQASTEFSEKFLAQIGKLQDAGVEVFRDSLKAYVSSLNQVQEATTTALAVNGNASKELVSKLATVSN